MHSKPEDPYAFLRDESLKLQALREGSKPVRCCPFAAHWWRCCPAPLLTLAQRTPRHATHSLLHPPLQSTMFTDSDLQGMFSLFDPVSNNYITADQARTALRNLGIKDLSSVPEAAGARLDSKAFLALARAALDKERTL